MSLTCLEKIISLFDTTIETTFGTVSSDLFYSPKGNFNDNSFIVLQPITNSIIMNNYFKLFQYQGNNINNNNKSLRLIKKSTTRVLRNV